MTDLDILSEFCDFQSPVSGDIDFDHVTELKAGGTTCDTFLITVRQKRYFVKRLKPELRDKEYNLAALRKEFDVGSSLHHSSIPVYRSLGKDYIVSDYIEGKTLAQMIIDRDPWLSDRKNIEKIMRSLLDVTGYLHSRGITHCDIKADNILISSSTHNVMLVDFDKCHTPVMPFSSGNPVLYGSDKKNIGSQEIDVRALGLLALNLKDTLPRFPKRRFRNFIKTALRKGTDIPGLSRTLERKDHTSLAITVLAVLIGVMIFWILRIDRDRPQEFSAGYQTAADTIIMDPTLQATPSISLEEETLTADDDLSVPARSTHPREAKPITASTLPANNSSTAPTKGSSPVKETRLEAHEEIIRNKFYDMQTYFMIGENALAASSKLPKTVLQEKADLINRRFNEIYNETGQKLQKQYPEKSMAQIKELIDASPFYKEVKLNTDRILNALVSDQ